MRCFIVGNGPSLAQTPLDRLIGEVAFGLNRIHLIYPNTRWRPTHWCAFDRTRQSQGVWQEDIIRHLDWGEECYIREDIQCDIPDRPNLHREVVCEHKSPMDSTKAEDAHPKPWHLPQLCRFGGSALMAIQLAIRLGYDELYVVGCDLGYRDADNQNWFTKDYLPPDAYKAEQARRWNRVLEEAHRNAKNECDNLGIKIFNAGIGGDLMAYRRVKLENVLGQP